MINYRAEVTNVNDSLGDPVRFAPSSPAVLLQRSVEDGKLHVKC